MEKPKPIYQIPNNVSREMDVFSPTELAGIRVNNRTIRSATDEGMADDEGFPMDLFMETYDSSPAGA